MYLIMVKGKMKRSRWKRWQWRRSRSSLVLVHSHTSFWQFSIPSCHWRCVGVVFLCDPPYYYAFNSFITTATDSGGMHYIHHGKIHIHAKQNRKFYVIENQPMKLVLYSRCIGSSTFLVHERKLELNIPKPFFNLLNIMVARLSKQVYIIIQQQWESKSTSALPCLILLFDLLKWND